jgi:parvulin-like peptidyl-prolyl isomerase
LAAIVNGEVITLADFESELVRFQDARGTDLATQNNSSKLVLQALIERLLLAQGAYSMGVSIEDNDIDAEIEGLIDEIGGVDTYSSWLQNNQYTEETFRQALAIEMYSTEMIEVILSEVSKTELQAHARHILVATQEEAEGIQQQLTEGAEFGELAVLYSLDLSTRPAGGDLGWFPAGTLTAPEVEQAIFQLEPGGATEIIASDFGYHVVELIALEERALPYETLLARQTQAVENWLKVRLDQAEINIFIDME